MSTYDDQDERRERHEREQDREHFELEQLDREIRHAPAPDLGPAPAPRIPPAADVPERLEYVLELEPEDVGFRAWYSRNGEVVADSGQRPDPLGAVLDATRDLTEVWWMRPPTDRRGPGVVVLIDPQYGFPLSNLHPDGCKHDVFTSDAPALERGDVVRCAKCQAVLVPVAHVEGRASDA